LATIVELISCGAVSIFLTSYILSFKSYEFLKNELNDLAYASRNQNIRSHSSRYVTEGGAKMLIRRFRNNDTGAFRKYWRRNGVPSNKPKSYRISPREICIILLTSGHKPGKNTSVFHKTVETLKG